MSGKVSGLVLDHLPGNDHVRLVIALVLADAADHDGRNVRPSVGRVSRLARVAERTVQYHLRQFEQDGFLVLVRSGGGRGRPAEYSINLGWLCAQPAILDISIKGASPAPFMETVQKGCTEPVKNGAKRVQPGLHPTHDPVVLPTTTTNHQVVEVEELIEAAVWVAPLIKNEAGFRRKVRSRILGEGANAEDLRALSTWLAHKSRTEADQKRQERERRAAAERDAHRAEQSAQSGAYFSSLDELSRAKLVEQFATHLAANNSGVFQFYRKSGIESKPVQVELFKFISIFLSQTEATA